MSTDEKVRKRGPLQSAPTLIGEKGFPRQKGRFVRDCFAIERSFRQRDIQVLDSRIATRNLGIDDRIDDKPIAIAKWLGAGYLIYLGIRVWRSPAPAAASPHATGPQQANKLRMFNQGFLVAVSNPKGLIFFAAFLPQFIVPGTPFVLQLLVFGGTFVVVEVSYELLLAGMAQRIAPWLARHGRWFNRATGGTFIGVGVVLTTASR